jgi:hypothetical protein
MMKLCTFVGMFVMSYVGWYAGTLMGFEFFGCFIVSGIASLFGVWIGWKIGQRYI